MNQLETLFPGTLGLVLAIIVFIWGVLMLFAPFFWYGTNNRTRETSEKLDTLIKLQKETLKALRERGD